ncbi:MAG: hypothetical protein IT390_19085 [Nitrospira sp.]|nr:hypothetical protein [Nitrospira sp.]
MLTAALPATLSLAVHADEPALRETPLRAELGFERIALPAREAMGLAGATVSFKFGEHWWAGPAVYGAASGQRGGLFVLGAQLQRQWDLPGGWALGTGFYAGGGGGAAAPVGGGLMLRAAATLSHDIGPLRAGLSWSYVRFPSGDIGSSQLGVVLSWERPLRSFVAAASGQPQPAASRTGLGVQRLAGTAGAYALQGSDRRRLGMVGGRAEWAPTAGGWFGTVEAGAAASGGAAGYMEILGGVGWRQPLPLWPALSLEARAALGLGGGGAVPTGGGPIGKWALGASLDWGGGLRSGIEFGRIAALDAPLRARTGQLWLALDLEPASPGGRGTITRNEWSGSLQHWTRAQRSNGPAAALDTVGLKLDRFVGDHAYLSAQAHSAYAGGAGAFSVGLVGAGLVTPVGERLRIGAELLVGAAGGGGVASGGGAIAQALAWGGWAATPALELRLGVGAVKSLRGGSLSTPVVELAFSHALGLGGR